MSYLNDNKILMCNKLKKHYIYWITDFYAFVVQKYTERIYLIINICSLITILLFSIMINKNIFLFEQGKDLKRMFQVSKEEEFSVSIREEEEEEEGMRDWNFKRYETMHA